MENGKFDYGEGVMAILFFLLLFIIGGAVLHAVYYAIACNKVLDTGRGMVCLEWRNPSAPITYPENCSWCEQNKAH